MRPVNLIPGDRRRGARRASRGSIVGYAVLGLLGAILVGVVALVQTGNSIDDRKAELAALEQREDEVAAQASALAPYTEFATLAAARELTIRELAMSRFDWERVLNELALVLPEDVWLTELTGTVSPDVQLDGGGSVASRDSIQAPALEMVGCAVSQDAVANLVTALEDIDGTTRVGLEASERGAADAGGGAQSGGGDCRTRDFIAGFQIVVAFDAATSVAAGSSDSATPPSTPAPSPSAGAEPAAEVEAEQSQTEESAAEASDQAELLPT
jgi:Tfp pilus assembly protein PilN